MQFKPGDIVDFDGQTVKLKANLESARYPIQANGYSFTLYGRHVEGGPIRLRMITPAPVFTPPPMSPAPVNHPSVTNYPLGQVQTLEDGTQIYHPTNGQPFQLIPIHKVL